MRSVPGLWQPAGWQRAHVLAPDVNNRRLKRGTPDWRDMKTQSVGFDVFDERAHKFVEVESVLASNARLTDLLAVLQRERDPLDLLLGVTNAVVTHLDTRELFRAVARSEEH